MTRAEAIERMQRLMPECNRCPCIAETCKTKGFYDDCKREAEAFKMAIEALSTDIVRCKDCRKHNISTDAERNICPLTWFRGKAQGHEFDYQFCVYGERKEQ